MDIIENEKIFDFRKSHMQVELQGRHDSRRNLFRMLPEVFTPNLFFFLENGVDAKVGS